jgi:hypothetical protein
LPVGAPQDNARQRLPARARRPPAADVPVLQSLARRGLLVFEAAEGCTCAWHWYTRRTVLGELVLRATATVNA